MTDRELLEAAAKAAGLELPDQDDTDEIGRQYGSHLGLWCKFPWGWEWFRPHIDDGQALRLAVKLGLLVDVWLQQKVCIASNQGEDPVDAKVEFGADPYAATRRAIVRAAAEIGKHSYG